MEVEDYENRIMCGDCLAILKTMPDNCIDLIVTSPPYNKGNKKPPSNTTWSGKKNMKIDYGVYSDNMPEDKYQKRQVDVLNECLRVLKPKGSLFYNHKPRRINRDMIFPTAWLQSFRINQLIIWNRKNSPQINNFCYLPTTEHVYWIKKSDHPKFYRKRCMYRGEIWDMPLSKDKEHPAPFPIELPTNCINACTDIRDIVLDPYVGCGTTAIASVMTNRRFIGIDISKHYCKVSNDRIRNLKESNTQQMGRWGL